MNGFYRGGACEACASQEGETRETEIPSIEPVPWYSLRRPKTVRNRYARRGARFARLLDEAYGE